MSDSQRVNRIARSFRSHGARLSVSVLRQRKMERGAALFIVVLVIMALTGVAMFAAKSASTNVEVAGRYRQSQVTHQIARLGMQSAFSEVSRDPETYIRAMTDTTVFGPGTAACENQVKSLYVATATPAAGNYGTSLIDTGGCYAFQYTGVEASMATAASPTPLQLVHAGDATAQTPSGLGAMTTRPDFKVELTDKDTWDQPVSGYAAGSGVNMKFYSITMTAKGLLLPRDPAAAASTFGALGSPAALANLTGRSSVEQIRAQVMVGPLPSGL